jgi:hypothetical protein
MNCDADKESNHVPVEEGYFWLLAHKDGSVSFPMKIFDEGNGK